MSSSALFPTAGANKNARFLLEIQRQHCVGYFKEGIIISKAAAEAVKLSQVDEMSWKGVQLVTGMADLSFIYIHSKLDKSYKVYLAPQELVKMAEYFRAKKEVLNGSVFAVKKGNPHQDQAIAVSPHWSELVDPNWSYAFIAWIKCERPDPPSPSILEPWSSWPGGRLTFPGIPLIGDIHSTEKKVGAKCGALIFDNSGADKMVYFDYGEGVVPSFAMRYSKRTGKFELAYMRMVKDREVFHKNDFQKILGEAPTEKEYSFYIEANKEGIYLGTDRASRVILYDSKSDGQGTNLIPGEKYYLTIKRIDQQLGIQLFYRKEDLKPFATAAIPLTAGIIHITQVPIDVVKSPS